MTRTGHAFRTCRRRRASCTWSLQLASVSLGCRCRVHSFRKELRRISQALQRQRRDESCQESKIAILQYFSYTDSCLSPSPLVTISQSRRACKLFTGPLASLLQPPHDWSLSPASRERVQPRPDPGQRVLIRGEVDGTSLRTS